MDVTQTGSPGSVGTSGQTSGEAGQDGGAGGAETLVNPGNATDTSDSTEAFGGSGGAGGNGGSGTDTGGAAGRGGQGGAASASTNATIAGNLNVTATATGGSGGNAGTAGNIGTASAGAGAAAGTGGAATASAKSQSTGSNGTVYATATAYGGQGGAGSGTGQAAGSGGVASNTTASGSGYNVTVRASQTGGSGGRGYNGAAGGAGAASTLTNAASGSTSGGALRLTQAASGGSGGYGTTTGGAGGAATSKLTFDDTTNTTHANFLYGNSTAEAGSSGQSAAGAGQAGAAATAGIALTGANGVTGSTYARGGNGGSSSSADGGAGGGTATANGSTKTTSTSATAQITANAVGGAGGSGSGAGNTGGAGGVASGSSAQATGHAAYASVTQSGGAGGHGYNGADGGAGAASTLTNAVSGSTTGGPLRLAQTANGGRGGNAGTAGTGGAGGTAASSLTFDDATANPTAAASLYGSSTANGGAGGVGATPGKAGDANASVAVTGANSVTGRGYASGGAGGGGAGTASGAVGGTATSTVASTGTTTGYSATYARAVTRGGNGGNGGNYSGSTGSGGAGGAATGTYAAATSAKATGGGTSANASAVGGSGGTGSGTGKTGGAGGAASKTAATATGFNATASVSQTGGAGGQGYNGAAGGAGAASTVTNAATASTTGGVLHLYQNASGGSGGYGSTTGGAGGAATSNLSFDDSTNTTNASLVYGSSRASGGSAGQSHAGAGLAGAAATASGDLTGVNNVRGSVYAQGGNGGAGSANGGAGGTATASGATDSSSTTGTARTTVTITGGMGGGGSGTGETGGAGGTASGTASANGHSAYAAVTQSGGAGGRGQNGAAGGAGAASTLTNAVSGFSTGGTLGLTQTAKGGNGGYGGTTAAGGAGGSATSTITFDDTTKNPTPAGSLYASSNANGGAGGTGITSGKAGTADASVGLTGSASVTGRGYATGGSGGSALGTADAGTGGTATSTVESVSTATGAASTYAIATASGGRGGNGLYGGSANNGGAGGAVTGTYAQATGADTTGGTTTAEVSAAGGAGGDAGGSGKAGGAGGIATKNTAVATGFNATATVSQSGGAGGTGYNGAAGGAGAASTLTNAVTAATTGGSLRLSQTAGGGSGGYGATTGGAGGAATSDLTFNDTTNAIHAGSLSGSSSASAGGAGQSHVGAGLTGASAAATDTLTGANGVSGGAYAHGGSGGGSGSAGGGAGGTATAKDASQTTSATGSARATVTATGGAGGSGSGTGNAGGKGGTASGTAAASGYSAYATVTQNGGYGGRGLNGAAGGAGAASTLTDAVSGSTTGGRLSLTQSAGGGRGGYGGSTGAGGAGGAATSDLTFNDVTTNTTAAGSLYASSTASGGAGGSGTTPGAAGAAAVAVAATGAGVVTGRGYATGGSGGGAIDTANGAAGGTATDTVASTSTTTGDASTYAHAAARGGSGGGANYYGSKGSGGAGGAATGTYATATSADATSGAATAIMVATGGYGGTGSGAGKSGGAGGIASKSVATAIGFNASASANQAGGAGGRGYNGAAGGAGAASTLTDAATGSAEGGSLTLSQTASGGAGGYSSTADGAGGAATSTLSFDDTTNAVHAASLYGRSNALGGNSGQGRLGAGGLGGAATAGADLTGANAVTALANATGGVGLSGGTTNTAGGAATATAQATSTALGSSGTANANATAAAGTGSATGAASATSDAVTAAGQLASAFSRSTGSSGLTQSNATTSGTGLLRSLSATAQVATAGSDTTQASANISSSGFASGATSTNAFASAIGLPSSSFVNSVDASDANVSAVFGTAQAVTIGAGWQSANYVSGATGTQDYKSTVTYTVNSTALTGDLYAGLLTTNAAGTGFSSLTFTITVGGAEVLHESFTSLATASAYFDDKAVNLGAVTQSANLAVTVSFDLVSSTTSSGFGVEYLLGTSGGNGPPTITAPSTVQVIQGKAGAIAGVAVAESGDTTGETFTVKLSDATGLLSATGTGVSGAGTTALTITGSLDQVNLDLATLTATEGGGSADTITLAASDSKGGTAAATTIAVAVTNVPEITAPGSTSIGLGKSAAIHGVSIAETNAGAGETFTVTLSDTDGLLSATGSGVSGSGSTALQIAGSLAQVNAALATLTDTNGTSGADTITINATDSVGGSAKPASIAVTVANGPVITAPSAIVVGKGQANPVTGLSLAEAGASSGETFTVTLTDNNGKLSATGAGVSGAGTSSLAVTGTLAQVNAALATVTDTDGTAQADSIIVAATDSFGSVAGNKTIAVTVNGPPAIAQSSAMTVHQGVATSLFLSLSESGNTTDETFTATIADTTGILSGSGTGLSGSGTNSVTVTGSLAQVNSDLATLTISEAGTAADKISVTVTDSLGNSAGPSTTAVTVNPALTPVITVPTTAVVGLAKESAISGISLAETGARSGEIFTVTVSDTHGVLAATGASANLGSTSLTIQGSLAQVNAALATLTDTYGNPAADTLSITASDSFGNVAAAASTAITVANNPVLAAPGTLVVGINQPVGVTGVSLSESGAAADETFTVTASDNNGKLSATGTGVSGAGTTSLTVTGTLAQVNAALATLTDQDGTQINDTITFTATDAFGNAAGTSSTAVTVNSTPSFNDYPSSLVLQQNKPEAVFANITESGNTTGESFTVVVSDQFGLLSTTGTGVTGNNTTTLTLTGTLSEVNASLNALTDKDGTPGADKILLTATDSFGNEADSVTIPVTVAGNPAITAPTSLTVEQGQASQIGGVSLAEDGASASETFTVTVSDTHGLLSADGSGVSGSGTSSLTITGTLADVNTDLASLADDDATGTGDTVTITAKDSAGNAATPAKIGITVNAPADPVFTEGNVALPGTATEQVLDLGTIDEGAAGVVVNLALLNDNAQPGDSLSGTYRFLDDTAFANAGFAAVSGLAPGDQGGIGTVTLNTGTDGTFSETIEFDGQTTNPDGSFTLAPHYLLIEAVVRATGGGGTGGGTSGGGTGGSGGSGGSTGGGSGGSGTGGGGTSGGGTGGTGTGGAGTGGGGTGGAGTGGGGTHGGTGGHTGGTHGYTGGTHGGTGGHTGGTHGGTGGHTGGTHGYTGGTHGGTGGHTGGTHGGTGGHTGGTHGYTGGTHGGTGGSGGTHGYTGGSGGTGGHTGGTGGETGGTHGYTGSSSFPTYGGSGGSGGGYTGGTGGSGGSPSGPSGGGAGDTHITTFDGLHYDFQAAGEFIFAHNADIMVQVRLEPSGGPQSPSGSVTFIEQTAIGLGTDRLTFDFTRSQPFWLNGAPVTLIQGQYLPLADGTIYAVAGGFVVQAKTGERVDISNETTSVILGGHTNGVSGLLGTADGSNPQNLTLPDGTVLPTTLTSQELYETYADAWRVTQANSLFDYGPGETTATYTIPDFPETPVTLADLPTALVQQATEYVASLGITNSTQQQDAVLDYILTGGSQTTLTSDANNTAAGTSTTTLQVTAPPIELLGIAGPVGPVSIATGTVNVSFQVFLNNPTDTPVVVTYAVPEATSPSQLGSADFGGTLPSGTVTIAAGATSANITIAVPGNLRLPVETLQLAIATTTAGVTFANSTGAATLDSTVPVEGTDAVPVIEQISGPGTLTANGTHYTLDLGTIGADGVNAINLAIANLTQYYGNTLAGTFSSLTGSGFTIVEPTVSGLAPGATVGGLTITAGTALGEHTETVTFNPTQTNSSNYAGKLAPITLTITDNVISPIAVPAATPSVITFNARVGGASTGTLTIANTSPIGSDSLGVKLTDSGGHVLPAQTSPLAPGASATLALNNLATTSGSFTDTLTVAYISVPPSSTGHPTVNETGSTITLDGTVYLPADPILETTVLNFGTVHQGDAETNQLIKLLNAVAPGTLSDELIAQIGNLPAGLFTTNGAAVTIDPGETLSIGGVGLDTSRAGVVDGKITIDLTTHDAAQPDAALGTLSVDVEGTVIGDAIPDFVETSGPGGISGAPGQNQTLNLGSIVWNSGAETIKIAVKNAASGPADSLTGSLTYTSLGETTTLPDIGTLAPGDQSGIYEFTISPTTIGQIDDVITLTPVDNVIGALPVQTLTIEGEVIACFLRGTHIATPDGERTVERLRIGDFVRTAAGKVEPIRWIGERSYQARFIRRNRDVLPVCIQAGALADGIPHRDLWVSALHAMFIDGVLVPACELVNGVTIIRAETLAQVDYFHIELARHDLLLAEGAASESFIDDDSRMMFHNAYDFARLYPDAPREPAVYCAERVTDGFMLDAIRHRLDRRAGLRPGRDAEPLAGYLDIVESRFIAGWAQNPRRPESPVCLDILIDGLVVTQTLANHHRQDLVEAGLGHGQSGFALALPDPLTVAQMARVVVRRSSDHAILARAPNLTRVA